MVKLCVRLAVMLCCLLSAGAAFAEGFALYEYSARGVALGGAMVARKPDPSVVAYNPALLTQLPGVRVMGGATAIIPVGKAKWTDRDGTEGTTTLRDSIWGIPHGYYTHQLNDDWFFGIGEFTRFGLGFEYPHEWPGRFNIYEVSLVTASLNPNIAWRATDKLSLAAGVEFVYVNLDIKKRALRNISPATSMEFDTSITDADDFGIGFNLAGHYRFNDQWAAGVVYRSQVRVHAWGDADFSYVGLHGAGAGNPMAEAQAKRAFDANFEDGRAHSTVILPDSFAFGLAWTPRDDLSIEVGAIWTRWSTFRHLNIHLPDKPVAFNHKHWKDVWRFNAGVEYDALDWLTLRAGYVYDQSPMGEAYEDYLVPTADRHILSAGVGFKWDSWTMDFAYAFIKPKNRFYKEDNGDNGTWTVRSNTADSMTHLISFSLGYEF